MTTVALPTFVRRPLKITLVALYHEYGDPKRGYSYEYQNLYLPLKELFEDVQIFDFYSIFLEQGKDAMNRVLSDFIKKEKPDLAIFALFTDQFIPDVIEELKNHTTTLCYFFDDDWRVEFADSWVPHFTHFTTPRTSTLRYYRDKGHDHVIYSPFGYNHSVYQKKNLPKIYDVTFVGGFHPYRNWIVKSLRKAKINLNVWGHGWPEGRLDQEAMIDVFNQSKINLNISNSVHWDLRYLLSSRKAIRNSLLSHKTKEQVKGRHFEINGCGGFQLTSYAEDLERHFTIGEEIAIHMDIDDLIDKIRYYLKHDDEREAIADAGYMRALAGHTSGARFTAIADHIFGHDQGTQHGR